MQSHGKSFSFVILSLNSSKFRLNFFSLRKMSVVLCQPTLSYLDIYLKCEYLRTSSVFALCLYTIPGKVGVPDLDTASR